MASCRWHRAPGIGEDCACERGTALMPDGRREMKRPHWGSVRGSLDDQGPERPWMDGGLIGQPRSGRGLSQSDERTLLHHPSERPSFRPSPDTIPHLDAPAGGPIAAPHPMMENLPSCWVVVFVALLVLYLARLNQRLGAGATPDRVESCTTRRRWSAQRLHETRARLEAAPVTTHSYAARIPPKQHRRYVVTGGSGECRPVRLPVPVEDGRTLGEGNRRTALEAWTTSTRQPFRL